MTQTTAALVVPSTRRQRAALEGTVPGRRSSRRGDTAAAAAFIGPGALFFVAFIIGPAVVGLALSFFDWNLLGTPKFVGTLNFERLIGDRSMWNSLGVSGMFLLLGVIPTVLVGFMLAALVNVRMRGIGAWRVLYLTPMVASTAVTATIWQNIFQPRGGVLNQVLAWFGIEGPRWFSDPVWARPALVVVLIWTALPLVMLIYIAGLQRISDDLYSAASLDGAGPWRQLWSITWPNVASTTVVVVVLQFIGFISGSFEMALLMTNGGPLGTTTSLALYAYKAAFEQRDVGYASALSLFQIAVIAVLLVAVWGAGRIRRAR